MTIRAILDLTSKTLSYDGESYPMADAGLSKLRELVALADPDTEVTIPAIPVYTNGWNRNPWSPAVGDLAAYASTMAGCPIYHDHVSTRLLGRGGDGAVDDQAVNQDIIISTPLGLSMLTAGHDLRFSISMMLTETTELTCSLCGSPLGECGHGFEDEGFQMVASNLRHAETSITHYPACEGTGSDSLTLSAQPIPDLMRRFSMSMGKRLTLAVSNQSRLETENDKLTQLMSQKDAELSKLQLELTTTSGHLNKLKLERANRIVMETRKAKGLMGSHDDILAQYLANPEQWEANMKSVPTSTIATVVSGLETPPPEVAPLADSTPQSHQALYDQALSLSQSSGRPVQECWRELRNMME